ncbi:hypothetical protein ACIQUQ_33040 [Streptomyces sp. NPDC101118]|uniref:hypothetical protein n=1 Tax=Streptomyces sp. NPDC101118 TaxID=3366109 RepID=UPI003824F5E7
MELPSRWFDVHTTGALLVRLAVPVPVLAFAGKVLERGPHLIYAVPVVWCLAAWQLSDSSATPPQEAAAPLGDEFAGETGEIARVVRSPEGVMCTYHPVRTEESQPGA